MKAADIEWGIMRGALIALGVAIVVSAILLGASYHFWETSDRDLKRANIALRSAEDEYRKLDELEQMIAVYYPKYQDLERVGIIGEERRLGWTEALERADEALKLPELKYTIDTQARHRAEYPLPDGTYKLFASEMNLNLGLLHGDDLFRLLNLLEDEGEGLFSVDACSLIRVRDAPGRGDTPHVRSTCRLYWYTIKQPPKSGGS